MSDPPSPASAYARYDMRRRQKAIFDFDASFYAPNATKAANRAHPLIMRVYTSFIDWP